MPLDDVFKETPISTSAIAIINQLLITVLEYDWILFGIKLFDTFDSIHLIKILLFLDICLFMIIRKLECFDHE